MELSNFLFFTKIVLFLGVIFLSLESIIHNLFWYTQLEAWPLLIIAAEFFACLLLIFGLTKGFKIDWQLKKLTKQKAYIFLIGFLSLIPLLALSKLTGVGLYEPTLDNVWLPYFIMENFFFVPIMEELIFRDVFQKLFDIKNVFVYTLISSLIPPVFYLLGSAPSLYLVLLFMMNLLFSLIYWFGQDIKLPIILHILLNLGMYLIK